MPTHDYIIENQSAPNFRADLNQALQAIVSNNSNATPPPVTYANMIWYDTTNKLLRIRNEADDAFITLGTLDQVANTFAPAGLLNLTQAQVENSASTVFGQVSGQRLAQAAGGMTLLGTLTTTSGSTQTLSGLTLTNFKYVYFSGASISASGNTGLQLAGFQIASLGLGPFSGFGFLDISGSNGRGIRIASGTGTGDHTLTTASTSISLTISGQTFTGGSMRLFGVK